MILKNKAKKVFIDLDGTIIDFHGPTFAVHGVKASMEDFPTEAGYDIVLACNILREREGLKPRTAAAFWGRLSYTFWRSLPLYVQASNFIQSIEALVGKDNVCFATSVAMYPLTAVAGRVDWLNQFFPGRPYYTGPDKSFLAHENSILIDDSDDHCEAFAKAGGTSILIPRPWNKLGSPLCHQHAYDVALAELESVCA